MQIHLSDISSSEGMRIQKTAEFGMDTITCIRDRKLYGFFCKYRKAS